MLITGPRERRGTERFIVVPAGIARVAANFDPGAKRLDTIFVNCGPLNHVSLQRVSSEWKRLRIGTLSQGVAGSLQNVIFDAGLRCPDEHADLVLTTIQGYIAVSSNPTRSAPLSH